MSKILFVNPKGSELVNHGNSQVPMGYIYLAAECKRHGHQVNFVDGCISSRQQIRDSFKWNPDIIAIQCLTIKRKQAFDLMRLARELCPSAKIVTGGPHTGSCKEQVLENYAGIVDGVCHGEGEKWMAYYADHGEEPEVQEYYENMDDLPMPAYDLIDFRMYCSHMKPNYGLKAWVTYSRSCSWSCSFCSVWSIWGKYRVRSAENMLEELRYLYYHRNVSHFNFTDDIMTQDREAVMRLCEAIINDGMKIYMHFLTRVDCVDQELLNMLARAGCHSIDYGVESGSPKILKEVHKDSNKNIHNYPDSCRRGLEMTRKAGINANALIMLGNRGEDFETILATRRALKTYKPTSVHIFSGVYILPQTALFQKCKRDGVVDDDCWLDESATYYVPHAKWKIVLWHFMVASVKPAVLKRMVTNFLMQRQITGSLRRLAFLWIRQRFL